jgi:hypothetical protein
VGLFRDILRAPQICKYFFQSTAGAINLRLVEEYSGNSRSYPKITQRAKGLMARAVVGGRADYNGAAWRRQVKNGKASKSERQLPKVRP